MNRTTIWKRANPKRARLQSRKAHQRRRERVNQLKNVPCLDCKVLYPSYVMEFDHVRGRKFKPVAQLVSGNLSTLMREIAKCDVVCANCHRRRTHERRKGKK